MNSWSQLLQFTGPVPHFFKHPPPFFWKQKHAQQRDMAQTRTSATPRCRFVFFLSFSPGKNKQPKQQHHNNDFHEETPRALRSLVISRVWVQSISSPSRGCPGAPRRGAGAGSRAWRRETRRRGAARNFSDEPPPPFELTDRGELTIFLTTWKQ